ncbi:MAG: hypothetical protein VSS75_013690, partial [Candidatus Parabeggiatoa sp.]|nr:hypothetical protein [Candidatus Parabeggiatoa sp.]
MSCRGNPLLMPFAIKYRFICASVLIIHFVALGVIKFSHSIHFKRAKTQGQPTVPCRGNAAYVKKRLRLRKIFH